MKPLYRHFHECDPPHPLVEIEKDISALEKEILVLFKEVV